MVEVTCDPAKERENIEKHGISLKWAKDFDFGTALYSVDNSQDYGEMRYNAIGWLDASLHTLTCTESDVKLRAISLRKATRQEREHYAEET